MALLAETMPSSAAQHESPRLAVIINCYNYARYVGEAIRSVQAQASPGCELIVVDDGSTDNSWEVIQKSGVKGYRIENSGQMGACLFGVEATTASFILFLDADDQLRPGAIQKILSSLDSQAAKLQFPLIWINEEGDTLKIRPSLKAGRDKGHFARHILKTTVYNSPPTSGNVFRRDVALLLRRYLDRYDFVDGILVLAAPFMGDVISLDEPLALYRLHDANHSGVGRGAQLSKLEWAMQVHLSRIAALREVLQGLGVQDHPIEAERSFHFRNLAFMKSILRRERFGLASFLRLLAALWREYQPVGWKTRFTVFLLVAALLSNEKAKRLLNLSSSSTDQPARQFLKFIFS